MRHNRAPRPRKQCREEEALLRRANHRTRTSFKKVLKPVRQREVVHYPMGRYQVSERGAVRAARFCMSSITRQELEGRVQSSVAVAVPGRQAGVHRVLRGLHGRTEPDSARAPGNAGCRAARVSRHRPPVERHQRSCCWKASATTNGRTELVGDDFLKLARRRSMPASSRR